MSKSTLHIITYLSWLLVTQAVLTTSVVSADEIDVDTRILLQRTLDDFIQGKTQNEVYPFFDVEKAREQKLTLRQIHPVIFKKDSYYMMCADFTDTEGKQVVIDYIVRAQDGVYAIEQEIAGRRSILTQIFERIF